MQNELNFNIVYSSDTGAVMSSTTSDNTRCNNGDIRLTSGDSLSGRVEVCFNNQWGSVCAGPSMPWTENNAAVVCKQLGYSKKGESTYHLIVYWYMLHTVHLCMNSVHADNSNYYGMHEES